MASNAAKSFMQQYVIKTAGSVNPVSHFNCGIIYWYNYLSLEDYRNFLRVRPPC